MQKVKKGIEKGIEALANFIGLMFFGIEIEIKTVNERFNIVHLVQQELNNLFGNVFHVGTDAGGIEIKFSHKQYVEEGIELACKLFKYLQSSRFYADSDVGIHFHFSHEGIDTDEAYEACENRIKTYEDILFRIGSRTSYNGIMVNRLERGNIFNSPLSRISHLDKEGRNMIRQCNYKGTIEFRFFDTSTEVWRIKALIDFMSRFYAYSILHTVKLRTNGDNINDYKKGQYEYFKLYTFMNQNLGMCKENIHSIVTLYNDTFRKEDRVHKTKKQRREEIKTKKMRTW